MSISKDGYDRVEHDGDVNAKNISIVKSTATIFAVVNTAGGGQASVVVDGPVAIKGNVTIDSGNITLTSAPTLFAVVNTVVAGQASVVVDGPVSIKGNLTIDSGNISVTSNTAWSNPNTYIGLATVDIGSAPTLTVESTNLDIRDLSSASDSVAAAQSGTWNIGTVTAVTDITNPIALKGNVTLSNANGFIGLVSTASINGRVSIAGNVTVNVGSLIALRGNVTLDPGSAVQLRGNVTINSGTITAVTDITNPVALKGNVTIVDGGGSLTVDGNVGILGNVTISDSKGFIGLATVNVGASERYSYAYTSGPTTDWIVKGSAGFLHAIHVGAAVASSIIEISDHATDGDGNVQIYQAGDTIGPAVYPLNMTMGTGITLDITNQTHVTIIYK